MNGINNKVIKKLRFLKSGGDITNTDAYKKIANFDTLMSGASNLFVNFNNENKNNRKISITTPIDFIDNVEGSDSFYTPLYQTSIGKDIEERLNSEQQETETDPQIETPIIKEDKEDKKDPVSKPKYEEFKGKKSKKVFDDAIERVSQYDKRLTPEVKKFLTEIAARESGFKINANAVTNAHTGYFQMSNSNIKAFAKNADKEQFIRDPELQITAALNLIDEFTRLMSKETLDKAKEKGYNIYGLLAGAWAGGNGGVDSFILKDKDRSDTHHYRKAGDTKSSGVSVGQYIQTFSKLFNK